MRALSGAGEGIANLIEQCGEIRGRRGGATEARVFIGGVEAEYGFAERWFVDGGGKLGRSLRG